MAVCLSVVVGVNQHDQARTTLTTRKQQQQQSSPLPHIDSTLAVLASSLARFEELDANCLPEEEWRSTFVEMVKGICTSSVDSISA